MFKVKRLDTFISSAAIQDLVNATINLKMLPQQKSKKS